MLRWPLETGTRNVFIIFLFPYTYTDFCGCDWVEISSPWEKGSSLWQALQELTQVGWIPSLATCTPLQDTTLPKGEWDCEYLKLSLHALHLTMQMDGRNKIRIVILVVTEHENQKYIYQLTLSLCLFGIFNTQGITLLREKEIET